MILTLSRYKPLNEQIDDFLDQRKSWSGLDYSEIQTLAGHALNAMGTDAYECLTESDDLDLIMNTVAKQMLTGRNERALADVIMSAATSYFSDHLQEMYEQREIDRDYEIKIDAGLRPWTNQQTGEQEWSRV